MQGEDILSRGSYACECCKIIYQHTLEQKGNKKIKKAKIKIDKQSFVLPNIDT